MPLLTNSAYRPAFAFRSGHLQTIYPALLRRLPPPPFVKERITTKDGDFIDLNWLEHDVPAAAFQHSHTPKKSVPVAYSRNLPFSFKQAASPRIPSPPRSHRPLAILTHGLEGSTDQPYIRGMARALFANGYDVLAWNFRGCGGEPNLQLRSYHSGATDDLEAVIAHACTREQESTAQPSQRRIVLVGFSLGGNLVLKYLGERATAEAAAASQSTVPAAPSQLKETTAPSQSNVPAAPRIVGAVAISVPCDLAGSTTILERSSNRIYMQRFLKTLREKIREKHQRFPDALDLAGLESVRTFREFDDRYTAPIHGFTGAEHYYHTCSCLRVIEHIAVPTLLLNAADDPFLSPGCFPAGIAQKHPFLHLEVPQHGGHVGFVRHAQDGLYYSELRACAFLASIR